jgi:hypothetical protein
MIDIRILIHHGPKTKSMLRKALPAQTNIGRTIPPISRFHGFAPIFSLFASLAMGSILKYIR